MGVGQGRCRSQRKTVHLWRGGSRACSVRECEDVLCFEDVGAVALDDWTAFLENAVGLTESKVEKTGVKDELMGSEDTRLGELHFGISREI